MNISVIIPTYKPQSYIYECLDSLRGQTLDKSSFEVILVLNGCDEPWLSDIQSYVDRYSSEINIRLIHVEQAGVSNARNIAIDRAKGEYIAFIDDDDYVSPAYLEELLKNASPDCVSLSDSLYVDDITGKVNIDNPHHKRFDTNRMKSTPTLFESRAFFNGPCMKLLHRDIIGNRRFDTRFANGEDNLMMFLISDRIKKLQYTTDAAIYYRRIRENSATTRRRSRLQVIITPIKIMVQYIKYLAPNPFRYNCAFVFSRFAAEIKSIIIGCS